MDKKNQIKPNFFIVGSAKTGTTSLWKYLKQHPDIFMPENINDKEPSYFCEIYGKKNYKEYLQLFKNAGGSKLVGEASTPYLTSPESARWIRKEIPDAKIIIILRNPVERAYSLYRWMVNYGYEWMYPFERALEVEINRKCDALFYKKNPQYYYNYLYFESGLYSEQLARYFKEFPTGQIKVILLDDLKVDPIKTIQELYRFLECDPSFIPKIKIHNKAEIRPINVPLHFKLRTLERHFCHRTIGKVAHYLFEMNMKSYKRCWPKLSVTSRKFLLDQYLSDIDATQALIAKDLVEWKKI